MSDHPKKNAKATSLPLLIMSAITATLFVSVVVVLLYVYVFSDRSGIRLKESTFLRESASEIGQLTESARDEESESYMESRETVDSSSDSTETESNGNDETSAASGSIPTTTENVLTVTPVPSPTKAPTSAPTGPVWYDGYVDPRTVDYEIISNPGDLTVLINKYYAVPEEYVPELVTAASSYKDQKLRPEANEAWDLMRAACYEDTGKTLFITAGYSTFPQRLALFEGALKKVRDGEPGFTMKRVVSKYAYPGRSEHNVGLALDIREINDSSISSNFLNTTAGSWMAEHAHEYGFILRYPQGKGHITGYDFEAWHFRYLGVDLATTLYESGQTLEEYYGKEQVLP